MSSKKPQSYLSSGVMNALIALALFIGVNIIANETLWGWRLDLTAENLFTLSPGTRNILANIKEPITLRLYFSARQFAGIPQYQNHGRRVRDLLEEYEAKSAGKIHLQVIEPEPFSEAEDQAVAFGIQRLPISSAGEMAYLGLAGTNSTDDEETIPFLAPEREHALEYDITKLVYSLANPTRRTIGVVSSLPVFGFGPASFPGAGGGQPWMIASLLRELYEVRDLGVDFDRIDDQISTLVVIHPKELPDTAQFAIDQFVLRGGKALVFVDPLAEEDQSQASPGMPMAVPGGGSDLPKLFNAWGIELIAGKVVADPETAIRVRANLPNGAGARDVEYLPWLDLGAAYLNRDEFVTNELERVNVGSAGALKKADKSTIEFTPLISTSGRAGTLDPLRVQFGRDPLELLRTFSAPGETYVLAARLHGEVETAFPDGAPKQETAGEEQQTESAAKGSEKAAEEAPAIKSSQGPINVIVVADTDVLADRFWVNVQNFLGMQLPQVFADNANFVINAVDILGGNDDLIGLRSRGEYARPFTVVQDIQRRAEAQFREQERALEAKLEETENQLRELQTKTESGGELLLSAEQRAAIDQFRAEQVNTRKQLRAVQHNLRSNIERLGTWLKVVNIGAVPLLVVALALGVSLTKARRRGAVRS
jgi:ABC-type uncharacterized transport system involved in gliding motility auxiliary subunit